MNSNNANENSNQALMTIQNQISALQNQLALANQAVVNLNAQNQSNSLKSGRPNKFNGKNKKSNTLLVS